MKKLLKSLLTVTIVFSVGYYAFAGPIGHPVVTGIAVDLSCTDCIGTTEIADIYLLNTGDSVVGAVDGRFEGLVIENSQANSSASTNETAGIQFAFGGINDVARISADKLKDYTSTSEEESRIAFWVDINGTPTMVAHFMPDGLMLMLGDSRIRFAGTAGGGGQSIQYKDLSGSNRAALLFPGSDIVALVNRT